MHTAKWLFFSEKIVLVTIILFSFAMGVILGTFFSVLRGHEYVQEDCSIVYRTQLTKQDDARIPWFFEHNLNSFPIVIKEVTKEKKIKKDDRKLESI